MKSYQNPKGTYDVRPNMAAKYQQLEGILESIAHFYGYEEIRTPIFEDTGVFKRENDSSDMVNKEMYTFSMNGKDSFTLRPEGTAGVVRSYVQNKYYALADQPVKMYYYGPMFRHEHPQKGRYRQFEQFGIESIGAKSPMLDAEGIALGYSMIKALGLKNVRVRINSLGDDESRKNYREKLAAYFRPHIHELCTDCQRRLEQNPLRILDCKVDADHPVMKDVPLISDSLNEPSKAYFKEVLDCLDALEIPYVIDPKLVRGLDYYTDTVFEVENITGNAGAQATVFAGGRYDGLVSYFGGPDVSGFGFAMGMERLIMLAEDEGTKLDEMPKTEVYVMSLGNVGTKPLEIATECRALGYITDFNYASRSLKSQFKTVERSGAKVAVIIGESELAENKINIKNNRTKEQITVSLDEFADALDRIMEEENEENSL
ncbi:MAG: histidine--tRNA ligase [Erysipelotrichales bacterium]|nr:histidine--tRNA ligase [Erysipelotrichales bacterium]